MHPCDGGLTFHLLGLPDEAALECSSFLRPIFEGFVATELVKHRAFAGRRPGSHWFRDQSDIEVDSVREGPGLAPILVEVKASHTARSEAARGILSLRKAAPDREAEDDVVYRGAHGMAPLVPGVLAVDVPTLHARLRARGW